MDCDLYHGTQVERGPEEPCQVERGPEERSQVERDVQRPAGAVCQPAGLQRSSTESSLRGVRRPARPRSLDRPAAGGPAPIVARGRSMSAVRPGSERPVAARRAARVRRPSGRAARPVTARLPDLVPACDRAASASASSVSSLSEEAAGCGERVRAARAGSTPPELAESLQSSTEAELDIKDGCLVVSGERALRWGPDGRRRRTQFPRRAMHRMWPSSPLVGGGRGIGFTGS